MTLKPVNMLEGSIGKKMIYFTIPIMLGNFFQQLYNTADSIIVGNFLGHHALASVTASSSISLMLIGFMMGLSNGAGVVISRYFGAKDKENLSKAIHTTVAFGLLLSSFLTVFGVCFAPQILKWMGTPETVIDQASTYLQIFFCGCVGIGMYNIFVGIMQAVGDNKRPLYYLICSSVLNVILDLIFVTTTDLGVAGAAIATVISQYASALWCLFRLSKTNDVNKVSFSKIRIDKDILKQIIRISIPSGMQNSIISFANVIAQSYINSFGDIAMAGIGAFGKIESLAFVPILSFNLAITTFISQNLGAEKYERAKKGARFGIKASVFTSETIGAIIFILAPKLIYAFDKTPEVIKIGTDKTRATVLFFFLLAFSHAISSILRGTGQSFIPMVIMVSCWCVIRIIILAVAIPITQSIKVIYWVYPITWFLSSSILLYLYKKHNWLDPK